MSLGAVWRISTRSLLRTRPMGPLAGAGVAVAAMTGSASFLKSSTRSFAQPATASPLLELKEPVKLYQYDVCPFCNKVQAFLEYHGLPFEKIEVNPVTKDEIKFQDYRMVPFAIVNGEQVNGSGNIIDKLLGSNQKTQDEVKWCQWVDDHLVHVLPVNIYRTPSEALQSFDYITKSSNFSFIQRQSARFIGAVAMYFVSKRAKKKYNLSDNPRQDLYDAIQFWVQEGLGEKKFHSGSSLPDTADLAVFGVLRSIDGDNYLTWKDLRAHEMEHGEQFWTWYDSIKSIVETNRRQIH